MNGKSGVDMLLLLILLSIAFVISLGLLKESIIEFAHFLRNRKLDQEILRVAEKGVYGKSKCLKYPTGTTKTELSF